MRKADNFVAIVHTGDEQAVLARWRGVPFDAPRAAPDVYRREWSQRLAGVEEPDGVVVTV